MRDFEQSEYMFSSIHSQFNLSLLSNIHSYISSFKNIQIYRNKADRHKSRAPSFKRPTKPTDRPNNQNNQRMILIKTNQKINQSIVKKHYKVSSSFSYLIDVKTSHPKALYGQRFPCPTSLLFLKVAEQKCYKMEKNSVKTSVYPSMT